MYTAEWRTLTASSAGDGQTSAIDTIALIWTRKMLEWARSARSEGIAGAYLIAPFKRYEEILEMFV